MVEDIEPAEQPTDRLRRLISELEEFQELTRREVAQLAGWSEASISEFMSGRQPDLRYSTGRRIEMIYEGFAASIKEKKLARARALLASAGQ